MKSKSRQAFSIVDAMRARIFGIEGASWSAWRTFTKALYGLPLDAAELELFCKCTGRSKYAPSPTGFAEAVVITGRQSGKSRIAALLADYEAVRAERIEGDLYALMISQDQRAALRVLFSYARAPFERVPVLKRSVVSQTADAIRLDTGVILAAYPCRPQGVRGLRACIAVLDELAFFRTAENLPFDVEMLRAIRPCLATTNGKLIVLSSPYASQGALWDLFKANFARDDSNTLVWRASAPDMNPTLRADYLQRMAEEDPEGYRSEVLGEFRAGVSAFLDPEAIDAVVARDVRERAPVADVSYQGFVDASAGRRDAFTCAVSHFDSDRGIGVLDALRAWRPPFNPSGVIAEAADLLKRYRINTVRGDRFGGEFCVEHFRANSIRYEASELDRSAIYMELLPLVNSRKILLLDLPELLRELRGLIRQRGSSGRDRVDHSPRAHDDLANAAAGALVAARQPSVLTDEAMRQAEEINRSIPDVDTRVAMMEFDRSAPWDQQ
jgi:hypothetical protein